MTLGQIATERAKAMEAAIQPLRERLDAADARFAAMQAPSRLDAEDLRVTTELAHQLAVLMPAHGLPLVAFQLRDAVAAGKMGFVSALLPLLKSLYERPGQPYERSTDLYTLIGRCERLCEWRVKVAGKRRAEIQRSRWALDELSKNPIAALRIERGDGRFLFFPLPESKPGATE
jgi:hypothetical protein